MNKELSKTVKAEQVFEVVCREFDVNMDDLRRRSKNNVAKKIAIHSISKYTPLTLCQRGDLFKMDYAAVSQLKRRFEAEFVKSEEMQDRIGKCGVMLEMSNVET